MLIVVRAELPKRSGRPSDLISKWQPVPVVHSHLIYESGHLILSQFVLISDLGRLLAELLDGRLKFDLHGLEFLVGVCNSVCFRHHRHKVSLLRIRKTDCARSQC